MTDKKKQVLGGIVDGFDAFVLMRYAQQNNAILYICETETQLNKTEQILKIIAPQISVLSFPAWDTIPYDRVSPNAQIESERLDVLSRLSNSNVPFPLIILTTVSAILQKLSPVDFFKNKTLAFKVGDFFDTDKFTAFLNHNGYTRTQQVMQVGEYALRGGIIDVFATGMEQGYRLDLFGDILDAIRLFDPLTQKTSSKVESFSLKPVS